MRLTLLFVAALALLGGVISTVTYVRVREQLHTQSHRGATTLALAASSALEPTDISLDRLAGAGDTIWLTDATGTVIAHTFRAPEKTLAAVRAAVARQTSAGMVSATAPRPGGGEAIVTYSDVHASSALSTLAWTLLVTNLIGIALAALAGALLSTQVLRPVDRMRDEADRIPGDELARRLPEGRDDELGRLARAFNRLLARAQAASEEEAQFIADASHELKTPITAIEGHARIVVRAADRGEHDLMRESAEVVARESHRIALILRELLDLAQAEAAHPPREPARLDLAAREALEEAQALAPDRIIDAHLAPTTVLGDPDRLRELALILLDNALKYSPADTPVEIGITTTASTGLMLWVRDHGPGLTMDERQHVFARFARGSAAGGIPGSGLGLPIARAIAERHGATLELLPGDDGGTLAELRFPATAPL